MARDIRLDDLEITVAQLTQRIDALERHNAEHCNICRERASEQAMHKHFVADPGPARERERLIAENAKRPRVRISSVDGWGVKGKLREVTDPATGVRLRQTFVVDASGQEGPRMQVMLESEWLALLADDDIVRGTHAKGYLRVEQLTLDERMKYEREHFTFPFAR